MDTHLVSVQQQGGTTGISSSCWFFRAGTTRPALALLPPPPSVEKEDFPLPRSKTEEKFRISLAVQEGAPTFVPSREEKANEIPTPWDFPN